MLFHLRILVHAIMQRKKYLALILLPPFIFLVVQAFIPHRYHMTQDLAVEEGAMFVLGQNPLETVRLESLVQRPEILFTDTLALMDLRNHLLITEAAHRPEWSEWLPSTFAVFVQRAIYENLSLTMKDGHTLSLEYHGPDRDLGAALINFYSQRLMAGARRAAERSLVQLTLETGEPFGGRSALGKVYVEAPMQVSTSRVLYSRERAGPALWTLGVSTVIVLSFMCLAQYRRPRLYSVRQASRCLDARVLGSFPDLNKIKFH